MVHIGDWKFIFISQLTFLPQSVESTFLKLPFTSSNVWLVPYKFDWYRNVDFIYWILNHKLSTKLSILLLSLKMFADKFKKILLLKMMIPQFWLFVKDFNYFLEITINLDMLYRNCNILSHNIDYCIKTKWPTRNYLTTIRELCKNRQKV